MKHVSQVFDYLPTGLRRGALLPAACLLLALPAAAQTTQTTQENFGRVRIQYKEFNWQMLSTQNFSVYYYDGGQEAAQRAAEYAEQELQRITALIGYYPYSKTTLMLYNSVGDLRQSNIGLDSDKYSTGGETSLLRMTKVQMAFQGEQTKFKRDLSYQITRVLLNDMMYGGSLKEVIQSSYLLQLPDWFVSGAAAYAAEGWSIEMDDYMRDMTQKVDKDKAAQFFLRNPELAGQSLWNYIAERYGYTSIQNILNLTRITRDVETGISSSLNVPYKVFLRDWLTYYRQLNSQPETAYMLPDEPHQLMKRNRHRTHYAEPVLSPNGKLMAYTENDRGRYRVIVANANGKGSKHIIDRGGYKTPDQQVEYTLPTLAWRNNNQVAVVAEHHGWLDLRMHSADGGASGLFTRLYEALPFVNSGGSTVFDSFSHVLDMSYSADGKSLVITGVRDGQADLYLLRAGSRKPQQLTNDVFDDVQAVFMPDGESLIFSSNRWLDSTGTAKGSFKGVVNNYDLFRYYLDGRARPVEQLVASISNESRPRVLSDNEIMYLSEESGVRSLHTYNLTTRQRTAASSFLNNLKSYDYSPAAKNLIFVAADRSHEFVYAYPGYELPKDLLLYKTARQEILEDRSAAQTKVIRRPVAKAASPAPAGTGEPAKSTAPPADGTRPARSQAVDVSAYEFEEDAPKQRPRRNTAVAARPVTTSNVEILGPKRYDTRFSLDNVVSSFYADPLLGIGLVGQANMSDLFEDQRIQAGIFALTDLRTNRIYGEYTNLKKRYDWSVRFERASYYWYENNNEIRFARTELTPGIAYPLTHNLSLRGNARYVSTAALVLNEMSTKDDRRRQYWGGSAELVFDNAISTGVNMWEGTRMKAGVLKLNGIGNSDDNFGKLYVDLRHYQKVFRQIVWANRASYGQFFGPSAKLYRLGGMDNWLNAKYDDLGSKPMLFNQPTNDPADIFYQQFATNLRGFNYNQRTGPKYVLFNSELRIPIIQVLSRKPIYSGFFRNLQLTAFTDAGTAYSGANPFSENNSNNTRPSQNTGNRFTWTVVDFSNPLLVGYGFGARTTMLGFYTKVDVAWGQENYVQKGPKFYFTLGYDF